MGLFRRKPFKSVDAGEFRFDFFYEEGKLEHTYLQIGSVSGIFSLWIGGNTHAYGYLLAAAQQGRTDQLQGYAVTLFVPAMTMAQDQGLCNDVQKAINKWMKRKETEAKSAAKTVTDSEEMASQAFMESVVERSLMSKKEAKAASEADKELMREVLHEKEDENGE